jgi:8-oxo-dGTP pyrophosphatase MutT (NUDIX family)
MSAPEFDPTTVPVRDAATVMLVRDGAAGLEVFMMRRNLGASFAAGMYAFPGGAVDDADRRPDVESLCDGRTDADASRLLELDRGGLAFWIAVIRECFEEAGVLLAHTSDGATVRLDGDAARTERFSQARHAIHDGSLSLLELCRAEELHLDLTHVQYVAHWITPVGERRRFDTRFFVASSPAGQSPLHDGGETVDSLWIAPAEALARFERKELGLFPPTVAMLRWLEPMGSAADAVAAGAEIGIPPCILPVIEVGTDGKVTGVRLPDGSTMGAST